MCAELAGVPFQVRADDRVDFVSLRVSSVRNSPLHPLHHFVSSLSASMSHKETGSRLQ